MSELISSAELSNYLGVTMQTLYNWRNAGMPTIKVGAQYRYELEKVMQWLQEREESKKTIGGTHGIHSG